MDWEEGTSTQGMKKTVVRASVMTAVEKMVACSVVGEKLPLTEAAPAAKVMAQVAEMLAQVVEMLVQVVEILVQVAEMPVQVAEILVQVVEMP